MNKVVISMTTLPDRYDVLLTTLKCIRGQVDQVYLTLPYVARRFNQPYPEPCQEIKDLCTIVRCQEDYGPICKIYGALMMEDDPNTLIMTLDDDNLVPDDFVQTFLEKHQLQPKGVITGCGVLLGCGVNFFSINTTIHNLNYCKNLLGFTCPEKGRAVNILQGFSGVLYQRHMFPDKDQLYDELLHYSMENNDVFKSDDILISAYLNQNDIKIYTFNNMPLVQSIYFEDNALSADCMKMFATFKRAFYQCQEWGMFKTIEQTYLGESPIFKIPFACFLIIVLIITIILYIYYVIV